MAFLKSELPHNVLVILSATSSAVIHALCQPCKVAALHHCSHVVAVLFSLLDHVKEHGVLSKPCTSNECTWNKGKKREKDPKHLSSTNYPTKRKKSALHVIDFDPRPAKYRQVKSTHIINGPLRDLQSISTGSDDGSMWESQLQFSYEDYDIDDVDMAVITEQVKILYQNLTVSEVMMLQGTEGQSQSEKWFSECWLS